MDWLLSDYPQTVALVQIHWGCTGDSPWGNARFDYYATTQTPTVYFDGVLDCVGDFGDVAEQYDWYLDRHYLRQTVPTDLTLEVLGWEIDEGVYTVTVRVCMEAGGEARSMRVHLVQVLDDYPSYPAYSRNGFVQAAPEVDLWLSAGDCTTTTAVLEFDAESLSRPGDIRMIAWAQDPLAASPPGDRAEVYQAVVATWPLVPDCNANGIADAIDISAGTSEDLNGNGIPDECEDCNWNGVPDFIDIAEGTSQDCNGNAYPDECDIAERSSFDCNLNGVPDECDVGTGAVDDLNGNGIPDECECRGDCDCDGMVAFGDIMYFVASFNGYEAWVDYHVAETGVAPTCPYLNADANGSGSVAFDDIPAFVNLVGQPCQMH